MGVFTVYEKLSKGSEDSQGVVTHRVAEDGFSVLAFAFPLLWLLWHRLWIEAGLFFVFSSLGMGLLQGKPLFEMVGFFLLHLIVGFEAREMYQDRLKRLGFSPVARFFSKEADEAQIRYLARIMDQKAGGLR